MQVTIKYQVDIEITYESESAPEWGTKFELKGRGKAQSRSYASREESHKEAEGRAFGKTGWPNVESCKRALIARGAVNPEVKFSTISMTTKEGK